jgi:hypothetical protein
MRRNENAAADAVARQARDGVETAVWAHCGDLSNTKILVTSDGSCAGGRAGAGAAIFLYSGGSAARLGALAGITLLGSASSVDAEFEGVILGLLLCIDFLKLHSVGGTASECHLHILRT